MHCSLVRCTGALTPQHYTNNNNHSIHQPTLDKRDAHQVVAKHVTLSLPPHIGKPPTYATELHQTALHDMFQLTRARLDGFWGSCLAIGAFRIILSLRKCIHETNTDESTCYYITVFHCAQTACN